MLLSVSRPGLGPCCGVSLTALTLVTIVSGKESERESKILSCHQNKNQQLCQRQLFERGLPLISRFVFGTGSERKLPQRVLDSKSSTVVQKQKVLTLDII